MRRPCIEFIGNLPEIMVLVVEGSASYLEATSKWSSGWFLVLG